MPLPRLGRLKGVPGLHQSHGPEKVTGRSGEVLLSHVKSAANSALRVSDSTRPSVSGSLSMSVTLRETTRGA